MATVIGFLIGVVVGAGVMFFVCRNNSKKFAEKEAELKAQVEEIKAKAQAVKDAVKG
jgi:gas vesicle protein